MSSLFSAYLTFCVPKSKLVWWTGGYSHLETLSQDLDPGITHGISVLKISRSEKPTTGSPLSLPLSLRFPASLVALVNTRQRSSANVSAAVLLFFGERHRCIGRKCVRLRNIGHETTDVARHIIKSQVFSFGRET